MSFLPALLPSWKVESKDKTIIIKSIEMKDCIKKAELNSARRSNDMKGEALLKKTTTKKTS